MGSFLQKLLTNPEDFKFYTGNQKGAVSPNNQNPRTIPFGRDRVGGKDSNQPYIKKGLLNVSLDSAFYNDFTIRGGILAPLNALEDVARLTKYFADIKNPKGLLFLAKENILSRIGTKTEASKGLGYAGGALNEGAYTPLSTIGQALIGFAGGHLNKQGLDPTGLFPGASINKYQDIIAENQINRGDNFDFSDNRLTSLYTYIVTSSFAPGNNFNGVKGYSLAPSNNILIQYEGGSDSVLGIGKTNIKYATKNDGANKLTVFDKKNDINSFTKYAFPTLTIDGKIPLSINLNRLFNLSKKEPITGDISYFPKFTFGKNQYDSDILLEYKGGPGSKGKVDGTTQIKYATKNDGFKLTVFDSNNSSNLLNANGARYKTWDYSAINSQLLNLDGYTNQDFRFNLNPKEASSFLSSSPNYINKNIEDNLNLGNPGKRSRNRSSYTKGSDGGKALDKLNASYIYKSDVTPGRNNPLYKKDGEYSDIIPFIISILNNDNQEAKNPGTYRKNMHFRAFIDSFSDSYDADWSPIEYMGRAEKLYKYKGFGRKISMAFTVVAQSREEITAMYDKLNFLASSLAPEYLDSLTSGYMAGNIAYITLGEYIYDQPGIINSLTFDIPEESPWEIGIDDNGNRLEVDDVRQVPHMIKVTGFNFTPIHKFRPEKQTFKNDTLGTDSTRLLNTGKQRYVDQLRPESTNYDKEVQKLYKSNLEIIKKREAEEAAAAAATAAALAAFQQSGIIVTPGSNSPVSDAVVGNNGIQLKGLAANNNLVF
jgi:hypothetical protein